MNSKIQINNGRAGIRPVYARRVRLNAEQIYRTASSRLAFRDDIDPISVLRTSYFHDNGLIGPNNHIDPKQLWAHLQGLERTGSLASVGIGHRTPAAENPRSLKNEIFHAVMGRLLDPERDYFSSIYACPADKTLEIDNALISLFKYGNRTEWDNKKPLFDSLGLRIDLTGAVFPKIANGFDGINLDNTVLTNSDMFYISLRGASLRGTSMQGVKLSVADLTGADLSGSDLYGAILFHAKFIGACLAGCDLSRTELIGTDFSGANLDSALILPKAFKHASFAGADLVWATLPNFMRPALNGVYVENRDFINWVPR